MGKEPDFTSIGSVDRTRRLPRLGKIRLGIKKENDHGKEYPSEVDYFAISPEGFDGADGEAMRKKFVAVYGDRPKALDVIFPTEDPADFFPMAYKFYGKSGLKCIGNGQEAKQMGELSGRTGDDAKEFFIVPCLGEDCEHYHAKGCRRIARLMVMIPLVSTMGFFQIDTTSWHSRVDVLNDLALIRQNLGRITNLVAEMKDDNGAMTLLPLCRLTREPKETAFAGIKKVHYTLRARIRHAEHLDLATLQKLARKIPRAGRGLALSVPEDDNDIPLDLIPKSNHPNALQAPQNNEPVVCPPTHTPSTVEPTPAQAPKITATAQAATTPTMPLEATQPVTTCNQAGRFVDCVCGSRWNAERRDCCPDCGTIPEAEQEPEPVAEPTPEPKPEPVKPQKTVQQTFTKGKKLW